MRERLNYCSEAGIRLQQPLGAFESQSLSRERRERVKLLGAGHIMRVETMVKYEEGGDGGGVVVLEVTHSLPKIEWTDQGRARPFARCVQEDHNDIAG